jgi:hypothetical protein
VQGKNQAARQWDLTGLLTGCVTNIATFGCYTSALDLAATAYDVSERTRLDAVQLLLDTRTS